MEIEVVAAATERINFRSRPGAASSETEIVQIDEEAANEADVQEDVLVSDPDPEDMAQGPPIQMPRFHGNPGEHGDAWLAWYINFAEARSYNENKRLLIMPFYFRDHAKVWYDALPTNQKDTWENTCNNFKARFNGNDGVGSDISMLTIKQTEGESCASYLTRFISATTNKKVEENLLAGIVLNGLKPSIKQIVMPQDPQTMEAVRKLACLAERTVTTIPHVSTVNEDSAINVITQKLEEVAAIQQETQQQYNSQKPPLQQQQQQQYSRRRRDQQSNYQPQQPEQQQFRQQQQQQLRLQPPLRGPTTDNNWQCIM